MTFWALQDLILKWWKLEVIVWKSDHNNSMWNGIKKSLVVGVVMPSDAVNVPMLAG